MNMKEHGAHLLGWVVMFGLSLASAILVGGGGEHPSAIQIITQCLAAFSFLGVILNGLFFFFHNY